MSSNLAIKSKQMNKNEFYKICLRHMRKEDNVFMFWGTNNSGYYKSIEDAGLYEDENIDFEKQVQKGDVLIHKSIIEKLAQKVRLPMYGERLETYANRNEFLVLPNTGQVRKEIGITILDIEMKGSNNSFDAYFKSTVVEVLKYKYSKTHFHVKGREQYFTEYWYCDTRVEAENRNKAISAVLNSGDFGLTTIDCSFVDFKKRVTCCRDRVLVFDKWANKE